MSGAKILISGTLLLAAAGTGGLAYVRSIDVDGYRPALVEELRAATGREVAVDGPIGLSLLPRPRFVIRGVAIANAPWGTRDTLARIDRVEAELALLPLLKGERRIHRVRLVRPDVWLETDSVGKVNWVFAGGRPQSARDGGGAPLLGSLDVSRVDVEGGRLTYRNGASGDITVLSIARGQAAGDGSTAPLRIGVDGAWNAVPFAVDGTVGPFGAVAAHQAEHRGGGAPVALQVSFGGATARIDGTVDNSGDGPGAALKLALAAPAPAQLARRFGIALPLTEPFKLDGDLRYGADRIALENATVAIGEGTATMSASVDLSTPRAAFTASIHAARTDISAFLRPGTTVTAGEVGPLEALLGSRLLELADGTADIRSDIVQAGPMTLRDVEARVAFDKGGIAIEPIRARTVGGAVTGSVQLDAGVSPPRLTAVLKAPAFAAGPLVQRIASVKAFGGVASVAANLSTTIGTPEVMLAELEGEALLAMGEGRMTLEPHETPFADHVAGPAALAGLVAAADSQDVPIECIAGRMIVVGGVARSEGFVLLSRDARVRGEGSVDLTTQRMALRFIPEARNKPLLLERAVSLAGPLDAPVVTLDGDAGKGGGAMALFPLRRFFSGVTANPAANACLRALPTPPRKRKEPGRPIAQLPDASNARPVAPATQERTAPAGLSLPE